MSEMELVERLRERYTRETIPPCRVCGAELTIASAGGGEATKWVCSVANKGGFAGWMGHYERSEYRQRHYTDDDVLEAADLITSQAAEIEGQAWQPIETAPKDEQKPILVWFDHDADPYCDPADPRRLTDYAANAEGGDFFEGRGVAVAVWRDGYQDSDGWEAANSYWMPGGWFAYHNGDASDHCVNATHWRPLPDPPALQHEGSEHDAG